MSHSQGRFKMIYKFAVFLFGAVSVGHVMEAPDTELGRGSDVTITKAAYSYRVLRDEAPVDCKILKDRKCRQTRLEIHNDSGKAMACAAQIYFTWGSSLMTPPSAAPAPVIAAPNKAAPSMPAPLPAPTAATFSENAGIQVEPGESAVPFSSELPETIDMNRTLVVCATLEERDQAEGGDAPFARAAPSACKYQMVKAPPLDDFYPTLARRADETGVVGVRLAFPLKEGLPKTLGVAASSGFTRIDRAAMLAASRMIFKTNCASTQRVLPVRFKLTE